MAYIGHCKFLPRHHPYKKQKKVFNGAQELELAPEPLSGEEILVQTKYWKFLDVQHCLDVMHIEKNVCANLIGTLLDIPAIATYGNSWYSTKTLHLVREIEFCGPVQLRDSNVDRALSASSFIKPSEEQLDQTHLYVIHNVNDVLPYVDQHMESLRKLNSGKARSKKWIQEEHNSSFSRWLSTQVPLALELPKNSITPFLRWIAHGPSPYVVTYSGYIINVAMIVEDNIGCPNVKVLIDVVTGENLTISNPVKGKIETLNQALGNIIEWSRARRAQCHNRNFSTRLCGTCLAQSASQPFENRNPRSNSRYDVASLPVLGKMFL
ncbi:uncharacterized protein E6C27_scaffold30G002280 [Cucumis melo var. makuwa]|uniref:Uncharacterized protein n=1 Tax=Cucumis melo var. makuwa TaxID=1194695 RepID=A0A5A7TVF4_CUCMM|nr:uncharacterized protein E6C27_scaffold30G002280 [Cucumis melo var. makuwa]